MAERRNTQPCKCVVRPKEQQVCLKWDAQRGDGSPTSPSQSSWCCVMSTKSVTQQAPQQKGPVVTPNGQGSQWPDWGEVKGWLVQSDKELGENWKSFLKAPGHQAAPSTFHGGLVTGRWPSEMGTGGDSHHGKEKRAKQSIHMLQNYSKAKCSSPVNASFN